MTLTMKIVMCFIAGAHAQLFVINSRERSPSPISIVFLGCSIAAAIICCLL